MPNSQQRKYALTRIRPGDYLFPSNDAKTLWRVSRYDEDGSLERGDGTTVRGSFWRVSKFEGSVETAQTMLAIDDDFLYSDRWVQWNQLLPTRAAAIEAALKAAAAMREP